MTPSNELDVQTEWEENTHIVLILQYTLLVLQYILLVLQYIQYLLIILQYRLLILYYSIQWGLRFERALFKRIAGLREVKMAWHNTLLNRTHFLLNRTYPKTPRLVQHCCNSLENLSTAVVESTRKLARHTALSYTPRSTMPCAAGSLCIAKPNHTPGPPLFTNHKCRVCGTYLHGVCGLPDLEGDDEMPRVCHGCVNSNNRKKSSTDPDAGTASSKRRWPGGQGTAEEKQAGAPRKKVRGADKPQRPSFEQQVEALDLLKSMTGTAVVAKLGIGVSTLYSWKAKEADIRKQAAASKPGAKSTKGADSSAGDKGQSTQPVLSTRPPPYTDVARQFGDLEGISERCSMAGVSYHLRRAKLAWMSEAGSKKTKQTCMADFV